MPNERYEGLRDGNLADDIHFEDRTQIIKGQKFERAATEHAGVVDEAGDTAIADGVCHLPGSGGDGLADRHVQHENLQALRSAALQREAVGFPAHAGEHAESCAIEV